MKGEYIFSRYSLIEISTAVVNLLLLILLSPYKSSRHWIFIQINTRQLHVINFPFVMLVAVAVLVVSFFLFFISPALFLLIPTIPGGLFLDHFLENTPLFNCGFHSIEVSFDFDKWWVENNNFYLFCFCNCDHFACNQ